MPNLIRRSRLPYLLEVVETGTEKPEYVSHYNVVSRPIGGRCNALRYQRGKALFDQENHYAPRDSRLTVQTRSGGQQMASLDRRSRVPNVSNVKHLPRTSI